MSAPAIVAKGFLCPKCGAPTGVNNTHSNSGSAVRRYRRCAQGHFFYTIERLEPKRLALSSQRLAKKLASFDPPTRLLLIRLVYLLDKLPTPSLTEKGPAQ